MGACNQTGLNENPGGVIQRQLEYTLGAPWTYR